MADLLDFTEEAKECLRLAKVETDPGVKTILVGMAAGWLMLDDHRKSSAAPAHQPAVATH